METLYGYVAFWKGKRTEVRAATAYKAQEAAAAFFGKRCKRWDVTVVLAEYPDGTQAVHSTASL